MGSTDNPPFTLRSHRPGDIGWITYRHATIYHEEYNWNVKFESLVAKIGSEFLENYDPQCERCWIAEKDGKFLGCVMLVKDRSSDQNTAKLRLLLVEPSARGLGVGGTLVRQCTEFAKEVGYSRIGLWTQSMLTPARRLYANEGYKIVKSEEHESCGPKLVGELWEMEL
ncbi:hypothetical protein N7532_005056 [Penicillium argentinense]|uniref:N-acetyltransferase domain-containing protein n=1 Tax=Penicillium argentinense TaxID=1131581 RepID=A0A9W9K9L5_9EURO|nr:uncharacterized protein N7532_005056 [Penicillium argentinense]KAJ5098055.1 hypothetical protein N7532_005056 [Penicillium argentinense]